jgi:hypothetical protein
MNLQLKQNTVKKYKITEKEYSYNEFLEKIVWWKSD